MTSQASAQKRMPSDGPYVRYVNNRIVVTYIIKDDDLLIPVAENYTGKQALTLKVLPEGHPEWGFTVKLRDSLSNPAAAYPAAGKTLFLSDIEGEFANFRQILLAAKVIDEQYQWTFDQGTLVIAGDLFDRGKDVVPELWLLYKLEDEAHAAGGRVDVLLGNHDIMNLSGDHRYTDPKYFKNAWLIHLGLNELFDADTELGRWLRSKNIIEKTGEVLVMHGGLSPALKGSNLDELNQQYRPYDQQQKADRNSPFWYRGYFMAPKISPVGVDSTLKQYDCKWILVGHTIVKWNIASFYGGKVIGIDVDVHKSKPMAASLENGKWYIVDDQGNRKPLLYKPANDNITQKDIL